MTIEEGTTYIGMYKVRPWKVVLVAGLLVVALGVALSIFIVNANKPVLKGIGQAEQVSSLTVTHRGPIPFLGDDRATQFIIDVSAQQFEQVLSILDTNKDGGIVFAVPVDYRQVEPLLTSTQKQQIATAPSPHSFLVTTTESYLCIGTCPELK